MSLRACAQSIGGIDVPVKSVLAGIFSRSLPEEEIRDFIDSDVRDRTWKEVRRTKVSEEACEAYVMDHYWKPRVDPVFRIFLEILYGENTANIRPDFSKRQIYSMASVVRRAFESIRRDIEPIPEAKFIIHPAAAIIYGIEGGETVDVCSPSNPYFAVRRQVEVDSFDGSVKYGAKLFYPDVQLILGLPDVPSTPIRGKYMIRGVTKGTYAAAGPEYHR